MGNALGRLRDKWNDRRNGRGVSDASDGSKARIRRIFSTDVRLRAAKEIIAAKVGASRLASSKATKQRSGGSLRLYYMEVTTVDYAVKRN
jgi:hypothetical protein